MAHNSSSHYNVLFLFSILIIISSAVYLADKSGESYYSAIAIITSASLALSAAILNTFYQRCTSRENNSLNFQQLLQSDTQYARHLKTVVEAINNRLEVPMHNFALEQYGASEEATAIRYVLNTWERAALAMSHGIYDEKYLYGTHKSMVLHFGVTLRGYIRETQKNNISFYIHFSTLVLKWTIRRDSFSERQTKRHLKIILRQLDRVKTGRITAKQK
jgi:hypothetical protein